MSNGFSQCNYFFTDLKYVSFKNVTYYWAPSSNFKGIESISYELTNSTDLVIKNVKYKVTIKDPQGKVLYTKIDIINFSFGSKIEKHPVFFDKPLKSKWTFNINTHPISFEILNIEVNNKASVESIAWTLYWKMKNCGENEIESGCKAMRMLMPNILNENWDSSEDVRYVLKNYKKYFDDNLMQQIVAKKQRIQNIKDLKVSAYDFQVNKNFKTAINLYLKADSLIDKNDKNEVEELQGQINVGLIYCYETIREYESAGDVLKKCCSKDWNSLDEIGNLYKKSKNYEKTLDWYGYYVSYFESVDTSQLSRTIWYNLEKSLELFIQNKPKINSEVESIADIKIEKYKNKIKSHLEIMKPIEAAILKEKLISEVEPNQTALYTITITRNNEFFGELEIEIYCSPNVNNRYVKWYNYYVYNNRLNTGIVRIYPNTAFTINGVDSKTINRSKGEEYLFPYIPNEKKVNYRTEKGLIYSTDDDGSLAISFGKNKVYNYTTQGTYNKINNTINLDNYRYVGKVVSGFETIDKIEQMQVNEEGVYLSNKALQEVFVDNKPNTNREILKINIKRKIKN